jgi:hypothetical protein
VNRGGTRKGPQDLGERFAARSNGYILGIVLLGRRTEMYWYNPTTRTSERAQDPSTDEQAIRMLDGHPDSAKFVSEYAKLRRSGTPIERALVLVGHQERLRRLDRMPVRLAGREERPRRARPSSEGYELLLAQRLREEGRDRRNRSALR